jgi:hypothetical protein
MVGTINTSIELSASNILWNKKLKKHQVSFHFIFKIR